MSAGLSERMTYLKDFQYRRLQGTYADLIAQERYAATCTFFFGKVYTAEDTSIRDAAVEEFHAKLKRMIGGDIIRCLGQIIDLQKLTVTLDERIEIELIALGAPVAFDMAIYETAYRTCDNYAERVEQIEILDQNLRLAHKIFRRFGIGAGLFALHEFEVLRGHGLVTGFLLEAYRALHPLRKIGPLADTIRERERARLDRIYCRQ